MKCEECHKEIPDHHARYEHEELTLCIECVKDRTGLVVIRSHNGEIAGKWNKPAGPMQQKG